MTIERKEPKKSTVRDPVQVRGIKTKQKIIRAGRDLIAARGYHNVTADEIAHAAGVSIGSFYAYFTDKQALLITLVDDYLDSGGAVASEGVKTFAAAGSDDLSSLIAHSITLLLSAHRQSPGFMRELLKMSLSDPEVKGRLSDMDRRVKSLIAEALIARGVDREKAAAVSFTVYHASEGIIHTLTFGRDKIDEDAVLRELTRLFSVYIEDIM